MGESSRPEGWKPATSLRAGVKRGIRTFTQLAADRHRCQCGGWDRRTTPKPARSGAVNLGWDRDTGELGARVRHLQTCWFGDLGCSGAHTIKDLELVGVRAG